MLDQGKIEIFPKNWGCHFKQGIFISQQKYVADLLKETRKSTRKPISTSIDPNHKLGEAKEYVTTDREMYQCLLGRLIYLSHTRPNISYDVSMIS